MSAKPATSLPRPLLTLARRYGIQASYRDIDGAVQRASPDILISVLRSFGVPIDDAAGARSALAETDALRERDWLDAVHVAWDGMSAGVPIRGPWPNQQRLRCTLTLATGEETAWTAEDSSLRHEPAPETHLPRRLPLPGPLPIGYHRLAVEAGPERAECRVISAPGRCATLPPAGARSWGLFAPLYALHSRRNPEAGDLGDLDQLVAWVAQRGGASVGTLPLLASALYGPVDTSPYAPLSRRFWNELYIDLDAAGAPRPDPASRAPATAPADTLALIDYAEVAASRRAAIEPLAAQFFAASGHSSDAFRKFTRAHPHVERYAQFRAAWERRGSPWQTWPGRMRHGDLAPTDFDESVRDFHLFAQWVAASQVEALAARAGDRGVHLYLDLPLGVHPDGFDAWDEQALFAPGLSVGAPPDGFFTAGQDWGFAPPLPRASRAQGHRYFRECLEHHLRVAGTLRIDHVMGLHRLFCIPHGAKAVDGIYVRYPAEELYAVLAVESHRHGAQISGEDLGTVPAYVRAAMSRHNIARSYVLQFDIHPDRRRTLGPVPRRSVAAINTHDMVPFAGFVAGDDLERRLELGLLDEDQAREERRQRATLIDALRDYLRAHGFLDTSDDSVAALYRAGLAWLARSPGELVLANIEDFWGERQPQNVPGTTDQYPNWRRRFRLALEDLDRDAGVLRAIEAIQRPAG